MKEIYYDAEGDILTVDFPRAKKKRAPGLQINKNIVLYLDPIEEKPIQMILLSYSRLVDYSRHTPLKLDTLASYPKRLQRIALKLMQQPPVSRFLQLKTSDTDSHSSVKVKKIALEPKILEAA